MDTTTSPHVLVDARGSSCPGPITDLAMAYRRATVGDTIELWATDPGVRPDVEAWAAKTGNQILSVEGPGEDGTIRIVLHILRR